jgi:hypothetical protein
MLLIPYRPLWAAKSIQVVINRICFRKCHLCYQAIRFFRRWCMPRFATSFDRVRRARFCVWPATGRFDRSGGPFVRRSVSSQSRSSNSSRQVGVMDSFPLCFPCVQNWATLSRAPRYRQASSKCFLLLRTKVRCRFGRRLRANTSKLPSASTTLRRSYRRVCRIRPIMGLCATLTAAPKFVTAPLALPMQTANQPKPNRPVVAPTGGSRRRPSYTRSSPSAPRAPLEPKAVHGVQRSIRPGTYAMQRVHGIWPAPLHPAIPGPPASSFAIHS